MEIAVDLLNVGRRNYGDAILCRVNTRSVLVDGAHSEDAELVVGQLKGIMSTDGAVKVDLLVVSHAHEDHIGCMPELIRRGYLEADWALLPAISLAWPPNGLILSEDERLTLAGLREEDLSFFSDEELHKALVSAAALRSRYSEMVQDLETKGTQVFEYTGGNAGELLEEFSDIHLKILGPGARLLNLAAEEMGTTLAELGSALRSIETAGRGPIARSPVELYRDLRRASEEPLEVLVGLANEAVILEAVRRVGAAVNAQSLVLSVGAPDNQILLTGDMQFADPGIGGELADEVRHLWDEIVRNGPYRFTKLSHHGSHNGFPSMLPAELDCRTFGICTGSDSTHHPSCEVIASLASEVDNRWVRTDRNGHIAIKIEGNIKSLILERGAINDPRCY